MSCDAWPVCLKDQPPLVLRTASLRITAAQWQLQRAAKFQGLRWGFSLGRLLSLAMRKPEVSTTGVTAHAHFAGDLDDLSKNSTEERVERVFLAIWHAQSYSASCMYASKMVSDMHATALYVQAHLP